MTTIKLVTGKAIKATVIDKIDDNGNQYSIAISGKRVYHVVSRDYDGAIWG